MVQKICIPHKCLVLLGHGIYLLLLFKKKIVEFSKLKFCNFDRYTAGLITLLRGTNLNDYCSWCQYMSCVPTSKWKCKADKMYCEVRDAATILVLGRRERYAFVINIDIMLLQSTQIGNQLNLTCIGNGRSGVYLLSDNNASQVERLCTRLCNWCTRWLKVALVHSFDSSADMIPWICR